MTLAELKERLTQYEKLMRLDKPIGTLLLLWPTLWGIWIASDGGPDWVTLLVFTLGTILMRSAGCVINDLADMDFDKYVERTRDRPLAAGRVTRKEALLLAAGLTVCALILILPLNRLTLWMSLPAVVLAASYPYTKRFLPLPQAYLGIAFSFGIPMAFAAEQGHIPMMAWWLLGANLFWVVGYDTIYAMVDKPDDLKLGIKTSAITFGRFDAEAAIAFQVAFVIGMAVIGHVLHMHRAWYVGLATAAALIGLQYYQIRSRDRARCMRAFLSNNLVGAVVFAGIAVEYHMRGTLFYGIHILNH